MMKTPKEERANWNVATEYDILKSEYPDFVEEVGIVSEVPENAVQETAKVVITTIGETPKEAKGNQEASGSMA